MVLEDVKALLGIHLVQLLAPFFIHYSYGRGAFPTIVKSYMSLLTIPMQTMYLIQGQFDLVSRLGA
jgi:hypothetical protein